MNETDALAVVEMLVSAWPWADTSPPTVNLWVAALAPIDAAHGRHAIGQAIATLDRPPSIAWFRGTARAERERTAPPARALGSGTADEANVRRFAAAARAALAAPKVHRHGDPAGPCPVCGGWRPDLRAGQ